MSNEKIKAARVQLGSFLKQRREEMGITQEMLAKFVGVTANTISGIETGRFAWDIDMQHTICAALEVKPYFSTTKDPLAEDYRTRKEDDPERYHGFYICDNLMLYPDQLAIVKLTHPRLFVRFNYGASYFIDFDDWVNNHTEMEWLDPDDKPESEEDVEYHLTDCWNFLAIHEREEDRLSEEMDNR